MLASSLLEPVGIQHVPEKDASAVACDCLHSCRSECCGAAFARGRPGCRARVARSVGRDSHPLVFHPHSLTLLFNTSGVSDGKNSNGLKKGPSCSTTRWIVISPSLNVVAAMSVISRGSREHANGAPIVWLSRWLNSRTQVVGLAGPAGGCGRPPRECAHTAEVRQGLGKDQRK